MVHRSILHCYLNGRICHRALSTYLKQSNLSIMSEFSVILFSIGVTIIAHLKWQRIISPIEIIVKVVISY